MKTLSPRPLAVAVAVLIALLVASIPAWADVGVLGDPPPTAPGPFTTQPPAFGREAAPTWSWQASTPGGGASIARYHVRVKQDSHDWVDAVPAIVNAPNTSWSPSPAFSADGIYQIVVQAEDGDGVKSEWAVSSTYVLDTTPPDVALSVPEAGLETNDANIVFRGTAEDPPWGIAAVHWTVTDPSGNPVAGSAQFTEPNAAFTPSSALSIQGIYTVRLFAEDRAGNTATAERNFRLDTIAPTMTQYELLTAKSRMLHGDLYMSDTQPRIRVVASDGSSGSGFNVDGRLEIEVFSDGVVPERVEGTVLRTPARPTLNAEAWTAVWSPSGAMPSGRYYPWITIIDDAGNKLERGGPAYRFVIDADSPEITGDSSVGRTNTGNGRHFTNSRRPLITWSAASDPNLSSGFPGVELPGAGVAGYQLEIWTKLEGQSKPQGTKVYTAPGVIDPWADLMPITPTEGPVEQHTPAAELNGLKDGVSYGAWILVRDRVGNMPQVGGEPEWVDPPFVFDSSPPSLPGVPTVVDAVDGRIGTGRPTIRWAHATDERLGVTQSGVDGYEVRIRHAGAAGWDVLTTFVDLDPDEDVDCVDADSRFKDDFDWVVPQLLANGSYELILRAQDVAGNVSAKPTEPSTEAWTDPLFFTVYTTPLTAPQAPYTKSPTNNRRPEWTWPVVPGAVRYGVYLDGARQVYVAPEAPGALLTWAPADGAELAEGRYYLQVTAVNDLGNESEKSAPGFVDIDLTPPSAPQMQALPEFTNKSEVLFQWEAEADAVRFVLRYVVGDEDHTEVPVGVKGYSLEIPSPDAPGNPEGAAIKAMVIGFDLAGNASAWPEKYTVSTTIDRTGPSVEVQTQPPSPTSIRTPTWAWLGADAASGVDYYIVSLGSTVAATTAEEQFTPASNLAPGIHVLKVKGVDRAGNTGDELVFGDVEIDITAPEPPQAPYTQSPTNNRRPEWTWPVVPGAVRYNVYLDGAIQGQVLPSDTPGTPPAWAPADGAELAEGRYYLQVTAVNDLGNESEKSAPGFVDIDLTPPAAPVMQALPEFTNKNEVTFQWEAEADAVRFTLRYVVGDEDHTEVPMGVKRYELGISEFEDGITIQAMVRAFDTAGNAGDWSDAVSTTIDRTGPNVRLLEPTAEIHTNGRRPVWKWSAEEDGTSPAKDHRVTLAPGPEGRAESTFWQESTEFVPVSDLPSGKYVLKVAARDELGNVGREQAFPAVYVVAPTVSTPVPSPGAYPVNKVSTLAFSVHGIWDAELEIRADGRPVPEANLIMLLRSPALTKFYVLINDDMVGPGRRLNIKVKVGDVTWEFDYDVLTERSGFGFGRLRPWDW